MAIRGNSARAGWHGQAVLAHANEARHTSQRRRASDSSYPASTGFNCAPAGTERDDRMGKQVCPCHPRRRRGMALVDVIVGTVMLGTSGHLFNHENGT